MIRNILIATLLTGASTVPAFVMLDPWAVSVSGASEPSSELIASAQGEGKPAEPKQDAKAPEGGARGASLIFQKRERDDLYKKFLKFMDMRRELVRVKDSGVESNEFKQADKRAKDSEKDFMTDLGKLGKKYNMDPHCIAAVSDWAAMFNDYVAAKRDFKASDKKLGSESNDELRDEPKAKFMRRVPKNYDPKSKAWPLLLYVQDRGRATKLAYSEDLKSPMLFDGDAENQGHIVVSIEIPDAAWSDATLLKKTIFFIFRDTRALYRIDPNRIVLGGSGEGVKAAMAVASSDPRHFAALFAKGGDPGAVKADTFFTIPIFVAGKSDAWAPFATRAKEIGSPLTMNGEGTADDIAGFLAKKSRQTYATHVMFAATDEKSRRACNWLIIDPDPQVQGRIEATIDVPTNTIKIECNGITGYRLLLSDALLDLSKPVTIRTNGDAEPAFTGKLIPQFEVMMNSFNEYMGKEPLSDVSDQGFIYTAMHSIQVRAKKKPASGATPEKKPDAPTDGGKGENK